MDDQGPAPSVTVHARIATSHAIPAYGGFRLTRAALEQMAKAFAARAVPMRYHHDLERPLVPRNVTTGIETLEDGELAVWAKFDVDQEGWEQYEREREAFGAAGGFSFSATETFAVRGAGPYLIRIAADASHFDQHTLVLAAEESLPPDMPAELARLFQFSWMPEPKVLIELAQNMLVSIPPNLLSSYLYDLMNRLRMRAADRSQETIFECHVTRTPRSRSTAVKIVAGSAEELRSLLRAVPELLQAEAQAAVWNGAEGQWRKISALAEDAQDAEVGPERTA